MHRKDSSQVLKHKQFAFKADKVSDDGTFSGYGSVFGNIDAYGEIVEAGAFSESIKRIKSSGDPLPMLWQHHSWEPIGGYDVLAEDDHGLKVEGWLMIEDIPLAKQAHALMKRRVVKGLSIGYYVEDESFNSKTGVLTLKKLDLREISPVTFPANELAGVDAVKAMTRDGRIPTPKEFEAFLREAGFSKTLATVLASRACGGALQSESAAKQVTAFAVALQSFQLPQL